ncbi:MAG: 2-pyrone-4,6-dicarbaxylate hydrolase [Pseudorhodoplanes sp.]|nr:2-pyrone-4,6-dicarbaxylate hydrolase [Pseudorhodoplanes sp.]
MSAAGDGAGRRKPRFALPPPATDAHCHVFGPAAVFPYAPARRYTPDDAPKEALFALHAHLGVGRAVIVQASCHGADNRAMLDAIAARPHTTRGIAIIDERHSDADLRAMNAAGIRGVRFNFVRHLGGGPDAAAIHNIVERIRPLGWHVVLHFDAEGLIAHDALIRSLPLPFVIDHMGRVPAADGPEQPAVRALLDLAKLDRCWIKVCGAERIDLPPYDKAAVIARAIVAAVPDRVLWGTDFPHPNPTHVCDEADLVDLLPQIALTAEWQRKLLVDNPARLYGF